MWQAHRVAWSNFPKCPICRDIITLENLLIHQLSAHQVGIHI